MHLQVGADILTEDYDVVKVHDQGFQQLIAKNGLHYSLECSGRTSESKRHPVVFKQPERGGESCLMSVLRRNFYLIIGRGQVNCREQSSTTQHIKGLFNARQRESISFYFGVQLLVIHAHAQGTILLVDQHNR